jgi:TDG/mug DNA glycosylase family protein
LVRVPTTRRATAPRSASATATASVRADPPTPRLRLASRRTLRDIIGPGLDVLFCGLTPGLYSAATGWHFARGGNRFWPALAASGFTPVQLHPSQRAELLACRLGITNFVRRATANAAELTADEIRAGRPALERKVRRYRPRAVAIVGIGAYRIAFDRPRAAFGRQAETLAGALLWVLPNTSGLNAHYQAAGFARAFAELRDVLTQRPAR